MDTNMIPTTSQVEEYRKRGYVNDDILPKTQERRNMGLMNYFTLWMGSIHNIPNYMAVATFLALLSSGNIVIAHILSGLAVATLMVVNGRAGTMYGIPFSMHLRATYGEKGSILPGFLRGCVAAIAWFGVQCYTGSQALLIIISKIFPGFLDIGGGKTILGITIPGLICFTLFWALNLLIGLGGGGILNKFTAVLSVLIYVVFGGMTVWAIKSAGGLGPIFAYQHPDRQSVNTLFVYLMVINSVMGVWAAPGSSASDFTQNAKSESEQRTGQYLSLFLGYALFGFMAVCILAGGSIVYDTPQLGALEIINMWDNIPAIVISTGVFLMTTISTNATGNVIPAAYQLSALFPKVLNNQKAVILASVIGYIILPWKMSEGIYTFLNVIGAMLGPVAGVLICDYYIIKKRKIDLDQLYADFTKDQSKNIYKGININAYIATFVGLGVSVLGMFVPALEVIGKLGWITGFALAFGTYFLLSKNKAE